MRKLERLDTSHCSLVTFAVRGLRFWLWGFVLGFGEGVQNMCGSWRGWIRATALVTFAVRGLEVLVMGFLLGFAERGW
jgi:ammonia channel protein AmtB